MKVLLFDLDWTLLVGGSRFHRYLIEQTCAEVYGIVGASLSEIEAHGMTSMQVIVEILRLHQLAEETVRRTMAEAVRFMEDYYAKHEDEDVCALMPGAAELLEAVKERNVHLGLLTGNIERIAWRRIERVGLGGSFAFGAFGDLAYDRSALVPIALQRAKDQRGIVAQPVDVIVVGDTPLDVACAKAAGVRSIAVGSGNFSMEVLSQAGADMVVATLNEQEEILRFLNLEDGIPST